LKEFAYTPEPNSEKLHVIFTARMVKEKGMTTLIEAAELLREEYESKVEFWLCGGLSDNPKAIKEEELRALCDEKYIKWLGHRTDVRELLMKSHIVAFPSYYREGLPKSLIEASAVGRPIVTTDSVGCRDVVEDGVNGYLIPIKDPQTLADRLKCLFEDKALRISMGLKSREFAERDFSVDRVVATHLEIYSKVLM
jgi:glycosyltransferase involved in cell wall biosynthesis